MASGAVSPLIQHLIRLFDEETELLAGVKDEVESLQRQLELMNAFLVDSERVRNNELMRKVVKQIRELTYKTEDVIDGFILSAADQSTMPVVIVAWKKIKYLGMLHKVGKRAKRLNEEIEKILKNQEKYATKGADQAGVRLAALDRYRRDVEENDVVGFSGDLATLVSQLTKGDSRFGVISIIGMGGLGKTTLAKKIYNNDFVKKHFDYCAWVSVSQDFRAKDLLLEILTSHMLEWADRNELTTRVTSMSNEGSQLKYLVDEVRNCLQGKCYLIVMDDVWSIDVWDQLRCAFPEDKQSRILITSRNKGVAPSCASPTPPYLLPFLDQDESWELLRKKVFGSGTHSSVSEDLARRLENMGRQLLLEGCPGLPLSIVVLADELAKKAKSIREWSKYFGKVKLYLDDCRDILALSYTHLPIDLKLCFLYLGVYPKDYVIPVRQLIQLWIAEGFIKQNNHEEMEYVAEYKFLENLIDQNLIQVVSRKTDGGRKTCRIPDLLRDICISECKEEMFLEVFGDNLLSTNKSRRLSFQGSYLECISSKCARSLFFFGQPTFTFNTNHWKWVRKHLKLVRVLYIVRVNLCSIPTKIEKLVLLRYLRIKSHELHVIPASICNLKNLETLDMRGSFLNRLPKGIWKLPRLRNLYMSKAVSLPDDLDSDVKALWKLQVLSTVSLNPKNMGLIVEAKLLRKLGIWFVSDEDNRGTAEVLASLHKSRNLQTLKIINCSEGPRLPSSFPSTITKITLREVRIIVCRDMRVLGNLPNLHILKLKSCLLSKKLHVFEGSFPQLEVLKLENLRIRTWRQERGAMQILKHLVIQGCYRVNTLPRELWRLKELQDVEVSEDNSYLTRILGQLQMCLGFNLLIKKLQDR